MKSIYDIKAILVKNIKNKEFNKLFFSVKEIFRYIFSKIIKFILNKFFRNYVLLQHYERCQKHKINLNYCTCPTNIFKLKHNYPLDTYNFGDYVSNIIYLYMTDYYKLNLDKKFNETKHIFGAGSILHNGRQDATIWGCGFLHEDSHKSMYKHRTLDIRSVRGPLSRQKLSEIGYNCPEVYGDPLILLSDFYKPKKTTRALPYCVVPNYIDNIECNYLINPVTSNWKEFIDCIVSSKLVISSSLHGIIVAETYGIPAILWLPNNIEDRLFKYKDYYYSTERTNFPVVKTISEALATKPLTIPNFSIIKKSLYNSFPKDLWT